MNYSPDLTHKVHRFESTVFDLFPDFSVPVRPSFNFFRKEINIFVRICASLSLSAAIGRGRSIQLIRADKFLASSEEIKLPQSCLLPCNGMFYKFLQK